MSESPLSTHAGPIAVIAGGLFAVAHLGQFVVMDRSNLLAMMLDPAFRLFSAAYAITFPLLLIALVALYWREAQEAGVFGAVAFCITVTGTVALAGDMWFEGFAMPWIAGVTPETLSADRTGSSLVKAWLVTVVLFALGWALFGIASWRARVFPVALSIALGRGRNRVHGRHASLGCSPRAGDNGARCLANPARSDSRFSPASRDNATLNRRNHRCGVASRLVDGTAIDTQWVAYSSIGTGNKASQRRYRRCPHPNRRRQHSRPATR